MIDPKLAIWIPARLGSTRATAKLTRLAGGLPVVAHTVAAAVRAAEPLGAAVAVVTDSPELEDIAASAGVEVIRVDRPCTNGSERLAHALRTLPAAQRPDIIVNVQGDEALVPAEAVLQLVGDAAARGSGLATLMIPGAASGRSVTVVTDRVGRALYFSRASLPATHPSRPLTVRQTATGHFGGHVGLYLYSAELLASWPDLTPSPLELVEGLEQLRALHHGLPMDVFAWRAGEGIDVKRRNGHDLPWFAIDTEADLERLRALLGRP